MESTKTTAVLKALGALTSLNKPSFAKDLFSLYLILGVNSVLPLVNTPYLARTLGPTHLGTLAFFQSVATISIIVIEFGFGFSATKELARRSGEHDFRSRTLSRVFAAKTMITGVAFSAILLSTHWVPLFRAHPIMLIFAMLWGATGGMNLNWYFQGVGRLATQAAVETGARALAVGLVFGLVHSGQDAWLVLCINGIASLLSLIAGLALASRDTKIDTPNFREGITAVRTAFPLFVYRAAVSICTAGNGVILGLFSTPASVGYYAGAEKITRGLLSLSTPVTQLLYSKVNQRMSHSIGEARKLLFKSATTLMPASVLVSALVFLFSHQITLLFLGSKFGPSENVLRILCALPPIASMTILLGIQWMVPLGFEMAFTKITVSVAIINIFLASLLAANFSQVGVSMATVFSELLAASLCFRFLATRGLSPFSSKQNQLSQPPTSVDLASKV